MDYNLALQEIKNWIKDLIIIQYRQSKKNRALIDLIIDLIFANCLILQIRDLCLSVEKSEGVQLDVVGKWVNLDRFYNGIDLWDHIYFSSPYYQTIIDNSYDELQGGFSTYLNFEERNGGSLMYKNWQDVRLKDNQMGDGYFRDLIKLKIIYNSINHTRKNIDEAIWDWSNGEVYTTWGNMEITYNYSANYEKTIMLAYYKNILPRPIGCSIILREVNNE